MVWLQLIICLLIILIFGRLVAVYGDIIAVKTGLGGLWIGLVLLSITTSLPELFNGISAIYIVDAPDLTIGNLLGANTFNLFNLALLDIAFRNGSLFSIIGRGQLLTGWFSLIMVAAVFFSLVFQPLLGFRLGWLGWMTPVIIVLYIFFVRKTFLFEQKNTSLPGVITYDHISLKKTYLNFSICAIFIIGAGVWLATIGEQIAASTGLGESFVGSLLIGFTTTLPEITVSFSALRLGAADLAVSNMIGSNMFNMFLISLTDILYLKGPILGDVARNNIFTGGIIIVLTLVTLAAIYFKPRRLWRVSWYSLLIISLFVAGAYINFVISR